MKKKEIVILSLLIISLITVSLYQTLATDITMNKTNSAEADLSYIFDITDQTGRVVNVKSGATKILDIFVTNTNNGTIQYGIAYTPSSVKTNDITIAQLNTSKDSVSGLINKDEKKQITIVIINNSTSDIALTLVPVTGYEHGGDLIVPSNHTLIDEVTSATAVSLSAINGTISGGNILTNILPNSSFENTGWNNCNYNTEYKKYGNYSCGLTGTASAYEVVSVSTETVPLNNSHIYYSSIESYQINTNSSQSYEMFWPIAEPSFGLVQLQENNKWNKYSAVSAKNTFNSGSYQVRVDFNNFNAVGTVYYDGGMLIDLTESYGSGNEPSKEWIDENIGYFEGSISNRVEELMSGNEVQFTVIPNSGYEFDSLECDGGNYDIESNTLTVSNVNSNKKCYIKFKKQTVIAAQYIESLLASNPSTMNNDDPDGNVRYMGADPNNYVKFNDELWRIVGVFNVKSSETSQVQKRLKIIKDNSIGDFRWDELSDSTEWSSSSLQMYLNDDYYMSLLETYKSMVTPALWYYTGIELDKTIQENFLQERGRYDGQYNDDVFQGKVGLLYPSDYGYATSGGTNISRLECMQTKLNQWSSFADCYTNNYLYKGKTQWTVTPLYNNNSVVVNIYKGISTSNTSREIYNITLPVVFLDSTVEIYSGNGTKTNPYTLSQ